MLSGVDQATLSSLIGKTINEEVIRQHWGDIMGSVPGGGGILRSHERF